MRHPDDRASRLLRIRREIAAGTYDESAGLDDDTLDRIVDAAWRDPPWSIGDPVLPVLPVLRILPSAGPSPLRGGPVSSERGAE